MILLYKRYKFHPLILWVGFILTNIAACSLGDRNPLNLQADSGCTDILFAFTQPSAMVLPMHECQESGVFNCQEEIIASKANNDDPVAQYNLALRHFAGIGKIDSDDPEADKTILHQNEAFLWAGRAARKGLSQAQALYGIMYANGKGVPRDTFEAHKWLNKAVEANDDNAQTAMGVIYANACGVPQNKEKAFDLLSRAANQGNSLAKQKLALLDSVKSIANAGDQEKTISKQNQSAPPDKEAPFLVSNITTGKEKRVALVIGNSVYQHTGFLKNPVNDASDLAKKLSLLNFDVSVTTDADLKTMVDYIARFKDTLIGTDVALFYYSGHGIQVKGENFLIPIDADVQREDDIQYKAVNVNDVLDKMEEAKTKLNLVILDACRNNPFPTGYRSATRGLVNMNAPSGTLLIYSTSPNNVAFDGDGRNGTFTKHLLRFVNQPNLEVALMLRRVRSAVMQETNDQQVPWENGSIIGEFYFITK
jgi:hypothetical protein